MKVVKEMRFEAAHMLSNYDGACRNLHGHSYVIQVSIEDDLHTDDCMVEDFNSLKNKISSVIQTLDHAIIFSDEDYRGEAEQKLLNWAVDYGMNYVIIHGRCTCEMIALHIKEEVEELLRASRVNEGREREIHVRLWETGTSFTEV